MTRIDGLCDPRFEPIRQAFQASFDAGNQLGAALAVTHHGKFVVDLYGGYADRKGFRPWQADTIVNVFSTTKIALGLCALMLVDDGRLNVEAPLHTYWPEMNRGGKERITVRHVLLHSAGLPGLAKPEPFETMHDWERMIHLLEEEPLWYEPGTMQAYHANTYGHLLGEVVRRITGEYPGQFFRHHVAEPLDIDFHIGLPESEDRRVAEIRFPAPDDPSEFTPMATRIMESFGPGPWWSRERRAADIPGGGGIGNARSIARMGAIFAMGGELDGVRLLSRGTIEEATREHTHEFDHMAGATIARALGFGRETPNFMGLSPDSFFWGGFGGSICAMNMVKEVSMAYTPNLLEAGFEKTRGDQFALALRPVLESLDD